MRSCTKSGWTKAANGSMPYLVLLAELPDGAVIVAAGEAYTIAHGRAFCWNEQGYQAAQQIPRADGLLTPPSTLRAIRAGYRPVLHPDLETWRVGSERRSGMIGRDRQAARAVARSPQSTDRSEERGT